MYRMWVRIGIVVVVIATLVAGASAYWFNQQSSSMTSSSWSPWGSSFQQSEFSSMSSGGGWGGPMFGGLYSNSYSSYFRSSSSWNSFWANGTQMSDVSGIWSTDLLGNLTVRLTGDDIIRASYVVDGIDGYMQGNFSSNASPVMDGFWFEAPEYRPLYQAGAVQITFENATDLNGIFAYADGVWGPFTGKKVRANLTAEEDDKLMDMPVLDWTVDTNQTIGTRVDNPMDTNPIQAT